MQSCRYQRKNVIIDELQSLPHPAPPSADYHHYYREPAQPPPAAGP